MLEHKLPKNEWTLEAAAHLLSRAAFGGSPTDVQKLFYMGHEQAVDFLLTNNQQDSLDRLDAKIDILVPSIQQLIADRKLQTKVLINEDTDCVTQQSLYHNLFSDDEQTYKNLKRIIHYMFEGCINQLKIEWLKSMTANKFSFRDKLALFWHSNIPIGQTRNSNVITIKKYLDVLRNEGQGDFKQFIKLISKQYEMAQYLNLTNNRVNKINENFARELLELFMLGEGNYTEKDIKEVARVFTGFEFDKHFNFKIVEEGVDKKPKSIFGQRKNFNPEELIEFIAAKKECADHVATKLWRFYVSEKTDRRLRSELGFVYRRQQMNTTKFLKVIFLSRAFYSNEVISCHIKSPVQLIVQAVSQLENSAFSFDEKEILPLLNSMGQNLFNPLNVKGWPGGKEWITANTLINRYKAVNVLTGKLSQQDLHLLLPESLSPSAVSDLISARLFYAPPSEKIRQNIVAFVQNTDYSLNRTKQELLKLIMSTPQYQLV